MESGLTFWKGESAHVAGNPLTLHAQIEAKRPPHEQRTKVLYVCSGSDEFCRIVASLGLTVTTVDMLDNAYSTDHLVRTLKNNEESVKFLSDLIANNDVVLWDTSIGHLDEDLIKMIFSLLKGKVYLLGLYDVPKLDLFGPKVKANPMMANIMKNSPTINPGLYAEVLVGCSLRFSADLGAFSIVLYDNIMDFPFIDRVVARTLEQANSF